MEKKSPKPFYSRKVSTPTKVYYFDACYDKRGVAYAKFAQRPTSLSPKKHNGDIVVHREISDEFYLAVIDVLSQVDSANIRHDEYVKRLEEESEKLKEKDSNQSSIINP